MKNYIRILITTQAAKLVLEDYFSEEYDHRAEYFTFDEENSFTPLAPSTPIAPLSAGQTSFGKNNDTKLTANAKPNSTSLQSVESRSSISSLDSETKRKGKFYNNSWQLASF